MTNKQLTQKIDDFLPFWEKDGNFKKQILEILNNKDEKYILELIDLLKDYYNSEEIIKELQKRQ